MDRLDVGETMRTDMFADAFVIIQTDIMRHIMEHGTPEEIQIVNDYGYLECNME